MIDYRSELTAAIELLDNGRLGECRCALTELLRKSSDWMYGSKTLTEVSQDELDSFLSSMEDAVEVNCIEELKALM